MAPLSHTALSYLSLWGLIATIAMTAILQGSQGLRLSRLSLPFLLGRANDLGLFAEEIDPDTGRRWATFRRHLLILA